MNLHSATFMSFADVFVEKAGDLRFNCGCRIASNERSNDFVMVVLKDQVVRAEVINFRQLLFREHADHLALKRGLS